MTARTEPESRRAAGGVARAGQEWRCEGPLAGENPPLVAPAGDQPLPGESQIPTNMERHLARVLADGTSEPTAGNSAGERAGLVREPQRDHGGELNWQSSRVWGRLGLLAGVAFGLALLAIPFAVSIFGQPGILAVCIACVCCLAPAGVILVLAERWTTGPAVLNLMLVGMAARALCCLYGVAVMDVVLHLRQENYLTWLSLFYPTMLACETWLLTQSDKTQRAKTQTDKKPGGTGGQTPADPGPRAD